MSQDYENSCHATFTSAASFNEDEEDDDDEPCFMEPETESVVVEKTHEVRVEHLMNNNGNVSSSVRVRDMLFSMDIPVQDFMVEQILACAHRMGMTERYRNRKVLRMRVEIEAVVNELPDEDDDDGEDEDFDSMRNDNETETAIMTEKLKKVVAERPNSCCPTCLEDFLVGTEATSMPSCSHLFHHCCIMPWLYKKNCVPYVVLS
ncbi:uncharacterized protein LOC111292459 [Durio zibethinus]|uniref:Uncharacterized protein LOC111292459 n=1 Tax=Durio zibethinus TaxID=66656 RepID=A0A6P5YKJ4_DURZI|nr:uncharacterized protein LOC111292459 [Durio zibethinus]